MMDEPHFEDQQGNPLALDEFFASMSEAILANVIACETAGIARSDVKMMVGKGGGMVAGAGMLFETPVTAKLSEEHGRQLFQTFGRLLAEYEAGRLSAEQLAAIQERHNVAHKVDAIRQAQHTR
jgi:hypothetical protein